MIRRMKLSRTESVSYTHLVAFTGLMEENCVEICDNEAAQGKAGAETLYEAAKEKWGEEFTADLIIWTEATEVGDGNRIRMHENFIPTICDLAGYSEDDAVSYTHLVKSIQKLTSHNFQTVLYFF